MKTNEILEDISIAVIVLTRVPINNIFQLTKILRSIEANGLILLLEP